MKALYLSACLLLCSMAAVSQNKNNHWQLGPLDFNFTTNPNTISTVTGIPDSGNYGYATMSDDSGNLLFYTDGITVWNKNHQIMQNGSNLGYNPESLQRAIIVPHPGNPKMYYIFRQERMLCLCGILDLGYYVYSVVDFTSNSLGALVAVNGTNSNIGENTYTKALKDANNNPLGHANTYSPLTFASSAMGGYWVIVQDEDRLLSYEVNASGLSAVPSVSSFAVNQIYNLGYFNQSTGSINGIQRSMFRIANNSSISKLYGLESTVNKPGSSDPITDHDRFYSLDFNSSTGMFSNFQSVNTGIEHVAFNFELSPDLQKAYFVTYPVTLFGITGDGQIIVKDLVNTVADRILYEFASPTIEASNFSFIQKDKFGSLLVGSGFSTANRYKYVHIIDSPDSFLGSKVKINHLSLNNKSIIAFPQLIPQPNSSQGCIADIVLSAPETVNRTHKASNTIRTTSSYAVNSGMTITLQAQNAIFLEPNTDIKSGSVFIAEIRNCPIQLRTANSGELDKEAAKSIISSAKAGLMIYPNPATNFALFSLEDGVIKNIAITSIDGRLVLNRQLMQKSYELDISSYTQGVYIIIVSTENGETFTAKLVKN